MPLRGRRSARAAMPLRRLVPTLAPLLFAAFALALVPWSAYLLVTLPSRTVAARWDVAWAGFDLGLAAALAATVVAAWRAAPWLQLAAVGSATMLLCDVWFDVMTSRAPVDLGTALGEAVLVEVPLAALCLRVALDPGAFAERTRWYAAAARRRLSRGRGRSGLDDLTSR